MLFNILGSGTSTGVPMVGCDCPVCRSTDPRDKRTRSSLLIRHKDRNIIIDTSTDLRQHVLRERLPRVDAVLFTHSHADHVNGIDDLRGFHFLHQQIVPCFASAETLAVLRSSFHYIFDDGTPAYPPIMRAHEITAPFNLFGIPVVPVPLEHGITSALGFRFGQVAYLTDCNAIPDSSLALLKGVDILVIDGLRWHPHPFHFNIESSIQAARQLNTRRIILTHLSHNVLYSDHSRLPPGVEFAYDGMEFEAPDF